MSKTKTPKEPKMRALAKRAVELLRTHALAEARRTSGVRYSAALSTANLLNKLGVVPDWQSRAAVAAQLSRALAEAAALGLVERNFQNNWEYCGADLAKARKTAERERKRAKAAEKRALRAALRTLGIKRSDCVHRFGDLIIKPAALIRAAAKVD